VEKTITISFAYVIDGSVAFGNVDTYFYSHLPHVETEVLNRRTGSAIADICLLEQVIVRGNSTLSCTALAAIIKGYLNSRNRRTAITIEGGSKRVEYEGPTLEIDSKDIESAICALTDHTDCISIDAHYLPR